MDHISEIKNRLPIEELVSQYVQLKKVGRNFKGLCPFHNERSPSFYVSTEKQLAYCFGCRKGGDHFKFIQEIEGIEFPDALKLLAEKAHVELPNLTPRVREKLREEKSQKDRLLDMHEIAAKFFEEQLWSANGAKALAYIQGRGVSDAVIKAFRLGYAPTSNSNDALFRLLIKEGYSRDECEISGLVLSRGTDANAHFDRFRNRFMFPILTPMGKVCAFGGRALSKEDEPKYLNSPETPIYHKSSILYGFYEAKNAIRSTNAVVFVEGYMDVIAPHQAGITHLVATSGTALTREHLEIIKRQTNHIILSFDADPAGRQAALRAVELALPLGFDISVAVWNGDEKDPDELCSKDPERYKKAVAHPQALSTFLIDYCASLYGSESTEQRVSAAQALVPFLAKVESPLFLDEWIKQAAIRMNISVEALYDELMHFKGKKTRKAGIPPVAKEASADPVISPLIAKKHQKYEYLLGLLLTYPSSISLVNQIVLPEIFLDQELQTVYRSLLDQYNQHSGGDFQFADALKPRVEMLQLFVEQLLSDAERTLNEIDAKHEVLTVALQLARSHITEQKTAHLRKLRSVTAPDEKDQLLAEYETLLAYENRLSSLT